MNCVLCRTRGTNNNTVNSKHIIKFSLQYPSIVFKNSAKIKQ